MDQKHFRQNPNGAQATENPRASVDNLVLQRRADNEVAEKPADEQELESAHPPKQEPVALLACVSGCVAELLCLKFHVSAWDDRGMLDAAASSAFASAFARGI